MRPSPKRRLISRPAEVESLEARQLLCGYSHHEATGGGPNLWHDRFSFIPKIFYPDNPNDGARIRGTSWLDSNANGKQDLGESGLFNQRIYLDENENGVFDSTETHTFTEADGSYLFSELPAGRYVVRAEHWHRLDQSHPTSELYELELEADELVRNRNFGFHLRSPRIIDVMLVYTPLAAEGAGGAAAIEDFLLAALGDTNAAFVNSEINVQYRLVHMQEVNYEDSNSAVTDIEALAKQGDGLVEEVHELRDQYGADLVSMIVETATDAGGIARSLEIAPQNGFSIVVRDIAAAPLFVLAHELGHLLGLQHDRASPHAPEGRAMFPYAYGRRVIINGTLFHDIMSYDPGIALPIHSNPKIKILGQRTGYDNSHGYDQADDTQALANVGGTGLGNIARAVHKTARMVSTYRETKFFGTDTVGDARSEAFIIGEIGAGDRFRYFDNIGDLDLSDFYRFTVNERLDLKIRMSKLRAPADIQLLGAGTRPIDSSERKGTRTEVLRANLRPGTYYLRIFSDARRPTSYKLKLKVLDNEASEIASAKASYSSAFAKESRSIRDSHKEVDEADVLTRLYKFEDLV